MTHTASCPDPCSHDNECPHGRAAVRGERCNRCEARRPHRVAVVPCSAGKLDHAAPARELYRGPLFRSALMAAEALQLAGHVDDVLILSALHGLVTLDQVVEPYDVRMGDVDEIATDELVEQLADHMLDELLPLLPKSYAAKLADAVAGTGCELLTNPLAGSRGVLDQRGRLRQLREGAAL